MARIAQIERLRANLAENRGLLANSSSIRVEFLEIINARVREWIACDQAALDALLLEELA